MRTLWDELPPPARQALIDDAPDWIVQALMRMRLGLRYHVPKAGQMPLDVARDTAVARYDDLKTAGVVPYLRRIDTVASELRVSPRTVRRWLARRKRSPMG